MKWGKAKDPPAEAGGWVVIGQPLGGSEAGVDGIDRGADGGRGAIATVDTAFDEGAFLAWTTTVYARATAAWHTRDPEPLRSVMDEAVWSSYAQHLLMVGTLPFAASFMGAARGTPSLAGTYADGTYQSALVAFAVVTDAPIDALWNVDASHRAWSERWLFQRPSSCRTHESGAVAVCPVCGAHAEPQDTGRCRYCHADITTRTAGWLVTRTATTMVGMARMDDKLAKLRERTAAGFPPPPVTAAAALQQPPRTPLQPPRAGA